MKNPSTTSFEISMVNNPAPLVYTREQVARILGVSEDTVKRWVREGRLRATRFTKRSVRISHDELAHFISARTA